MEERSVQEDVGYAAYYTDDVGARYSSLADESGQSGKRREAAMLLATTEGYLDDEVDAEECLKMAQQALSLCKEIGDASAEADALRLVIKAQRLQAAAALYAAGSGALNKAHDFFEEADRLAKAELGRFRQTGDARGQACMLLACAEVDDDRQQPAGNYRPSEKQQAVDATKEARSLFKKVGDTKMEGVCALLLANMSYRMNDQANGRKDEAFEYAKEALALFREAGDKRGEATAVGALAMGYSLRFELEECILNLQEALDIWRSAESWRMEANTLMRMAEFYVKAKKPREAMSLSEDAYDIYMEHDEKSTEKDWAQSLDYIVQAHILKGDDKRALRAAEEGVKVFQEKGLVRGEVTALTSLATAHSTVGGFEAAVKAMEEAQAVASDIGDHRLEGQVLLDMASIYLLKETYDQAAQTCQDAIELYQEHKDRQGEAFAMNKLNEVHLARSDYDACSQVSMEQRAIFQELDDKARAAACYLTVAGLTGFEGKAQEAIPMIQECIELFQEAYDREGEARALNFMAEIYSETAEYELAVDKAKDMIEVLNDSGDKAREANAYRVLCNIHLRFDKPAHAVRAANEALTLAKRTMDRRVVAEMMILVSQANVAVVTQDPSSMGRGSEKALRPAREAYKVAKTISSKQLMGAALLQVSQVQMMSAKHGEAMQAARESIELFRSSGDRPSEAIATTLLAELHFACMNPEKALDAANEGLAMAEELGDDVTMQRAKEVISKIQGRARVSIEAVQGTMPLPTIPEGGAAPAAPAAGASMEVAKPKGLDPTDVSRIVEEMAKAAIGVEDELYQDSPLMDSGLDSLTAVSFRNGLQQNLGVKLPSSLTFDYPTMKEVANRIVELSIEDAE